MKIEKIFNVKNKIIVITGGSGLLGRTVSKSLNVNGAKVIIIDNKVKKFNKGIDFYLYNLESVNEIKRFST